jgi:hypothetical protein
VATRISFEVSYSQFAVFNNGLSLPFNDWTDQHVAQGFSWRPGSVSFRTMIEAGTHFVEVNVTNQIGPIHSKALRAVEVPFEVPDNGEVEIGSIVETIPLALPMGKYLLRCEFLKNAKNDGEQVRLTFARDDKPGFAVLVADSELSISGELLTIAQPAKF